MATSKTEQRSGQDSAKMDDAGGGVAGREPETDEPRDARVVRDLLRSMGIAEGEYEPRVLHQFLELCYRYVVDVLSDSQVYAEHAGKTNIDPDDVRLAIQSKINFSFSQPPPREVLLELARTQNKMPLPNTIPPPGSIFLPSARTPSSVPIINS